MYFIPHILACSFGTSVGERLRREVRVLTHGERARDESHFHANTSPCFHISRITFILAVPQLSSTPLPYKHIHNPSPKMTTPTPRFTIHPINPLTDYPTLTTLSLLAIESNPLHYLTFRPSANIPYQTIFDYHRKTKVELHGEGIVVQTFKVVDHEAGGKIVGFASWVFDCSWPRVENVEVPEGMDGRFLNAFRDEVRGLVEEVILGENCVGIYSFFLMLE